MQTAEAILPARWARILCALAGFYAVLVTVYLFLETAKPSGSRDFHPFWYAGHFIHEERDPYAAYLAGEQPSLPIRYLDGIVMNQPVLHEELSLIPTNTPVMLLFLSLFSKFSWGIAKWLFLFFNLVVMLLTGWLALWKIPFGGVKLARLDQLFLFLLYFDFSATRIALENGQTTLIVFLLMLVALYYAERSWLLAGSALGIALSKYSLSLPIFLFFLYKKDFKVLLLAITVQGLGLLGLAAITKNNPLKIIQENALILTEVSGQPGVHLSHFVELFTNIRLLTVTPVLIMTLLVFVPILRWLRKKRNGASASQDLVDLHLITILFIWTLLVGYHRLYDTLILIVFVTLVFKGLAYPNVWKWSDGGRKNLLLFAAALSVFMVLPARIVDVVLPEYYGRVGDSVTTVVLLILLTIAMLLLRRLLQMLPIQPATQRLDTHDI